MSTVEVDDTDTGLPILMIPSIPIHASTRSSSTATMDHSIWAMISTMQMMVVIFHRL